MYLKNTIGRCEPEHAKMTIFTKDKQIEPGFVEKEKEPNFFQDVDKLQREQIAQGRMFPTPHLQNNNAITGEAANKSPTVLPNSTLPKTKKTVDTISPTKSLQKTKKTTTAKQTTSTTIPKKSPSTQTTAITTTTTPTTTTTGQQEQEQTQSDVVIVENSKDASATSSTSSSSQDTPNVDTLPSQQEQEQASSETRQQQETNVNSQNENPNDVLTSSPSLQNQEQQQQSQEQQTSDQQQQSQEQQPQEQQTQEQQSSNQQSSDQQQTTSEQSTPETQQEGNIQFFRHDDGDDSTNDQSLSDAESSLNAERSEENSSGSGTSGSRQKTKVKHPKGFKNTVIRDFFITFKQTVEKYNISEKITDGQTLTNAMSKFLITQLGTKDLVTSVWEATWGNSHDQVDKIVAPTLDMQPYFWWNLFSFISLNFQISPKNEAVFNKDTVCQFACFIAFGTYLKKNFKIGQKYWLPLFLFQNFTKKNVESILSSAIW